MRGCVRVSDLFCGRGGFAKAGIQVAIFPRLWNRVVLCSCSFTPVSAPLPITQESLGAPKGRQTKLASKSMIVVIFDLLQQNEWHLSNHR